VRDAQNSKKGFYRYVKLKRKVKQSVPTLKNKNGDLISTDEKADVLHKILSHSSLATSLLNSPKSMDNNMGTRGVKPLLM